MNLCDEITVVEAYSAMITFLENYCNITHSDEIGGMLGGLALSDDGESMDPAYLREWLEAVKTSTGYSEDKPL